MRQIVTKPLLILTILCISGCGSNTTYRPLVYGHDYMNMTIIEPKTFRRISCGDEEFNGYASVRVEDIAKLATVLKKAKLPRHIRILVEQLNNEVVELNGLDSTKKP